MVEMEDQKPPEDFNVFVGAETGLLKGLNLNQKSVIHKNIQNFKTLDRQHEITSMCWGNTDQSEILIGLRNKTVQVFDADDRTFVSSRQIETGEGPIVSLARWNGVTLTALKSGQVTIWKGDNPEEINALESGETLARMRQSPISPNIIATGGKENELRLWDLEKKEKPIFKAKNVPEDMLQLRVPVWVTDMTYMDDQRSVAISTRYKDVRLYDPGRQRRPIVNFQWGEYPLTCIAACPDSNMQLVVGAAHGRMGKFDMRGKRPDEPVSVYKGFAGAVRDIVVHPTEKLVFTTSLDRFLRCHHLRTTRLIFNEYLKSRLNCLLVKDHIDMEDFTPIIKGPKRKKKSKPIDEVDIEKKEGDTPLIPKTKIIRTDSEWADLTV